MTIGKKFICPCTERLEAYFFVCLSIPLSAQTSHFPKRQILDASKLDKFAGDNFKFNENGRKFLKWVENTVGKGESALNEQFLPFQQCFLKDLYCRCIETRACLGKGEHENLTFYSQTNLVTSLILGIKAHLIDTHLVVPRSRSSVKVKIKHHVHVFKRMAIEGALVFHKHVLF